MTTAVKYIPKQEKEKPDIKRMILNASMKLFTEEGFDKVSIRKIAEIIGYSPTTIYLYFKDKNEILFDLCEQGFVKMGMANVELTQIHNPLLRLHKMGENYIRFGLENPEFYDLMFIQEAPIDKLKEMNNPDWKSGYMALDLLKNIIQECMDKGFMEKGDVNTVSMAIWSMVHGMVSLAIRKRFEHLVEKEMVINTMNQSMHWLLNTIDLSNKK
jgi:AcrR family transcriptional regulator